MRATTITGIPLESQSQSRDCDCHTLCYCKVGAGVGRAGPDWRSTGVEPGRFGELLGSGSRVPKLILFNLNFYINNVELTDKPPKLLFKFLLLNGCG